MPDTDLWRTIAIDSPNGKFWGVSCGADQPRFVWRDDRLGERIAENVAYVLNCLEVFDGRV